MEGLVMSASDIEYETKLVESPDDVKLWLAFFNHKKEEFDSTTTQAEKYEIWLYQSFILQRAVKRLPRSYKLFCLYVNLRIDSVAGLDLLKYKVHFMAVNKVFESGLASLSKFPKIWVKYLEFIKNYQLYNIELIKDVYLRALQSLPLTQHSMVHEIGLEIASQIQESCNELSLTKHFVSMFYLKSLEINPQRLELTLEKLISLKNYDAALHLYNTKIINNPDFSLFFEKSVFQVYLDYLDCHIAVASSNSSNDHKLISFSEKFIDSFPDQVGPIVVKLYQFHISRNNHIAAESLLSSHLQKCVTLKDFKLIYESYLEFKEKLIEQYIEQLDLKSEKKEQLETLLDMQMVSFERLMNNRKHYVYDVLLRQDVNNCAIWLKKINLYGDNMLHEKLSCFVKAIKTINAEKAHFDNSFEGEMDGSDGDSLSADQQEAQKINEKLAKTSGLDKIWISYAQVYESKKDYSTATKIYNNAIKMPYKNVNDLVEIYYAWAEMILGNTNLDETQALTEAISLLDMVLNSHVHNTNANFFDQTLSAKERLFKSTKLWSFYLDLVESTGNIEDTCAAYDTVLKEKFVTPLMLINYVNYLESQNLYDKAFQVFERGLDKFNYYPIKFELNKLYLKKIIKRYEAAKGKEQDMFAFRERIRDLFRQSVSDCPSNLCKPLYLLFASFEETEGTKSACINVYKQCIKHLHLPVNEPIPLKYFSEEVPTYQTGKSSSPNYQDISEVYDLWIVKQAQFYGKKSNRKIFEMILKDETGLPVFILLDFSVKFALFESELKEYERARAIFSFAIGFVNYKITHPDYKEKNLKSIKEFWDHWADFELNHGNEDTYSDMLRAKRDRKIN